MFGVLSGQGGEVHQLDLDVFKGCHPGLGQLGGEGVVTHLGGGVGKGGHELGFAGVRAAHQGHLTGPLALHAEQGGPAPPLFALLFIPELGEPLAEARPQLIGPLVVGHDGEHGL